MEPNRLGLMEETPEVPMDDKAKKEYDTELLKHIKKIHEIAVKGQPTKLLKKINRYYIGKYSAEDKSTNQKNIIRNIVETKATMVIDSEITPSVVASSKNFMDEETLKTVHDISDLMDDLLKACLRDNDYESFRQKHVRDGFKKLGVAEVTIEQNEGENPRVVFNRIPFINFFPDPSAQDIEKCNYIFIKEKFSPITLKNKYPDMAEKIDSLMSSSTDEMGPISGSSDKVITYQSGSNENFAFVMNDPQSVLKNSRDITVWKLYLKDDSVFTAEELSKNTSTDDKEKLNVIKKKYPFGRMIVFTDGAKDFTLEDRPIPYPFGYPLDLFIDYEGESIWENEGEIESLFEPQDRVNRSIQRATELIREFNTWIVFDTATGLKLTDFAKKNILQADLRKSPNGFQQLTNNTMAEFQSLQEWIKIMESSMMEIARVNPEMMSGQRQPGTTSAAQVQALQQSPMTSIRAAQKNYTDFMRKFFKKAIILMQLYYTVPMMLRIGEGKRFVRIPAKGSGVPIQILEQSMEQQPVLNENGEEQLDENGQPVTQETPIVKVIKEIQSDLSLIDFEVEIVGGTSTPRSRTENAQIVQQLYKDGELGQGIEAISDLLTALDVPNRKAIMSRLQRQKEVQDQAGQKPPMPPAEKLGVSFKDMPMWAQEQWLAANGFTPPPPPEIPAIGPDGLPLPAEPMIENVPQETMQ